MKLQVFTRSKDNALYDMMREFIPPEVECIRCTGFDKWWEAVDYLYHIINTGDGWIVNLDEDAYVSDWGRLVALAEYMRDLGYDYCGHPDFGSISHRNFDWICMNPFFNIFNAGAIKHKLAETKRKTIDDCGFQPDMEELRPDWITGEPYRNGPEPFNGFFYWMIGQFNPLFLKAHTYSDSISTISLDHHDEPFMYHSWYSREFNTNPSQRNRILSLYQKAKSEKI